MDPPGKKHTKKLSLATTKTLKLVLLVALGQKDTKHIMLKNKTKNTVFENQQKNLILIFMSKFFFSHHKWNFEMKTLLASLAMQFCEKEDFLSVFPTL